LFLGVSSFLGSHALDLSLWCVTGARISRSNLLWAASCYSMSMAAAGLSYFLTVSLFFSCYLALYQVFTEAHIISFMRPFHTDYLLDDSLICMRYGYIRGWLVFLVWDFEVVLS
jgi:hypothetical protein